MSQASGNAVPTVMFLIIVFSMPHSAIAPLTIEFKIRLNSYTRVALSVIPLRMRDTIKLRSLVIKRSTNIDGHNTSVSLEDDFWNALRDIAHKRSETLSQLIASIDRDREFANLSSALRVFVLEFYKGQFARHREMFAQREITIQ
jgi:predicted DNA-binding ribbon-helix-helix protein